MYFENGYKIRAPNNYGHLWPLARMSLPRGPMAFWLFAKKENDYFRGCFYPFRGCFYPKLPIKYLPLTSSYTPMSTSFQIQWFFSFLITIFFKYLYHLVSSFSVAYMYICLEQTTWAWMTYQGSQCMNGIRNTAAWETMNDWNIFCEYFSDLAMTFTRQVMIQLLWLSWFFLVSLSISINATVFNVI